MKWHGEMNPRGAGRLGESQTGRGFAGGGGGKNAAGAFGTKMKKPPIKRAVLRSDWHKSAFFQCLFNAGHVAVNLFHGEMVWEIFQRADLEVLFHVVTDSLFDVELLHIGLDVGDAP